jgi:hypothetical protein
MKVVNEVLKNVCVIGDIHSSPQELNSVIKQANAKGVDKFVFLGDLWDRGYDPNGVVDVIYNLKATGNATAIVGNHDMKFIKHYSGAQVTLGPQQLETLSKVTPESAEKFTYIFADEVVAMFDPVNKLFLSHAAAGRPLSLLRYMLGDLNREQHALSPITLDDMFRSVNHINVAKKRVGNFMYGITNGDKTAAGLPVRLPITHTNTDDLDGWTYLFGHIHASNLFPENGNKHCVCLDYCCGEADGKLAGLIITEGVIAAENVVFSA